MMAKKLDISYIRLDGSRVFVRIPEVRRRSKWDRKADLGVIVGYENVGYQDLVNNKVIIARHVDIVEENINLVGFNENVESDENYFIENANNNKSENVRVNENIDNKSGNKSVTPNQNITLTHNVRKSQRNRKQPERYDPHLYAN